MFFYEISWWCTVQLNCGFAITQLGGHGNFSHRSHRVYNTFYRKQLLLLNTSSIHCVHLNFINITLTRNDHTVLMFSLLKVTTSKTKKLQLSSATRTFKSYGHYAEKWTEKFDGGQLHEVESDLNKLSQRWWYLYKCRPQWKDGRMILLHGWIW